VKPEDAKSEVIRYWMEKAYESLESAKSEQKPAGFLLQSTELIMPAFMRQVQFL